MSKDFISITDFSAVEIINLLNLADDLKKNSVEIKNNKKDAGRTLALLFEKPSLRTRVSFEVAFQKLGGNVIYLSPEEVGFGKREDIKDIAKVLERYVDIIALRVFSHENLVKFANYTKIPIINALSDKEHPCQILADLMTMREHNKKLDENTTVVFIGDGNNVATSLALACASLGIHFRLATPQDRNLPEEIWEKAYQLGADSGSIFSHSVDIKKAIAGADVVYTDTWISMGDEAEAEKRRKIFVPFQVNQESFKLAKPDAIFLHCLPAHRGEEVTDEVLDSARSVVYDQAENRRWVQQALFIKILG